MSERTAYRPEEGAIVNCPADRGDKGYRGRVIEVSDTVSHNHLGEPFHWATIERLDGGTKHVWPTNRLAA